MPRIVRSASATNVAQDPQQPKAEVGSLFRRLADTAHIRGLEIKQFRDAAVVDFLSTHDKLSSVSDAFKQTTVAVRDQVNGTLHDIATRIDHLAAPAINVFGAFKPSQLAPYAGNSEEDFQSWLRRFQDLMNTIAPEPEDAAKLRHLYAYLDGYARDRSEEIATGNPNITFQEMATQLKDVFSDPHRGELARQKLRTSTQNTEAARANTITPAVALFQQQAPATSGTGQQWSDNAYHGRK